MELKEQIKTILESNIEEDKKIELIIKLVQNSNYYYPYYPYSSGYSQSPSISGIGDVYVTNHVNG